MDTIKPSASNGATEEKPESQLDKVLETGMHKDDVVIKETDSLEKDEVPEIVNIYDYIYGNVQNKLDFYEEKCTESRRASVVDFECIPRNRKASIDYEGSDMRFRKSSVDNEHHFSRSRAGSAEDRRLSLSRPISADNERRRSISRKMSVNNGIRKSFSLNDATLSSDVFFCTSDSSSPTHIPENPEFKLLEQEELNIGTDITNNNDTTTSTQCVECQKHSYSDERNEVLTEINSQLKLDLESVNDNLKKEVIKTTDLTAKIANIESILETYYKDTKNNRNHFGTLYSAMKDYVVEQKYDYTYKKIKSIANYIENLKNTLDNQDKIIKNNFLENPYTTDLMVKHAFLRKQLDEMCRENEYLKEELRIKTTESFDMMKELNRQKFELETKYAELEKQREEENALSEDIAMKVRLRHEQQVQELQVLLSGKDKDQLELKKKYQAMIKNYQTENSILYGKLRAQNKV